MIYRKIADCTYENLGEWMRDEYIEISSIINIETIDNKFHIWFRGYR